VHHVAHAGHQIGEGVNSLDLPHLAGGIPQLDTGEADQAKDRQQQQQGHLCRQPQAIYAQHHSLHSQTDAATPPQLLMPRLNIP
jgi:hypothetical protein